MCADCSGSLMSLFAPFPVCSLWLGRYSHCFHPPHLFAIKTWTWPVQLVLEMKWGKNCSFKLLNFFMNVLSPCCFGCFYQWKQDFPALLCFPLRWWEEAIVFTHWTSLAELFRAVVFVWPEITWVNRNICHSVQGSLDFLEMNALTGLSPVWRVIASGDYRDILNFPYLVDLYYTVYVCFIKQTLMLKI